MTVDALGIELALRREFVELMRRKLEKPLGWMLTHEFSRFNCAGLFPRKYHKKLSKVIYCFCIEKFSSNPAEELLSKYIKDIKDLILGWVPRRFRSNCDKIKLHECLRRWGSQVALDWWHTVFSALDKAAGIYRPLLHDGYTFEKDNGGTFSKVYEARLYSFYRENKDKAKDAVLALIKQEREGVQIDIYLIRDVLTEFFRLAYGDDRLYVSHFEAYFLADATGYYSQKAQVWFEDYTRMEYLQKVEGCFEIEKVRVSRYLHIYTRPKLYEILRSKLLVCFSEQLIEDEQSGCYSLLRDDNVDDLSRMVRLFCEIPKAIARITNIFKQHVIAKRMALVLRAEDAASNDDQVNLYRKLRRYVTDYFGNEELFHKALKEAFKEEFCGYRVLHGDEKVNELSRMFRLVPDAPEGVDIVANIFRQFVTAEVHQSEGAAFTEAEPQVFVENVVALHDKLMAYVATCFRFHIKFRKALQEPYEVFCNKVVARCSVAELLASYTDKILMGGEVIEETFDKAFKLLYYIHDRDVFAEFYSNKLARRLLSKETVNEDHENSIILKLKQQFGGPFTSKMEVMVNDFALVKENKNSFDEYLSINPAANLRIDLTVSVLCTPSWPAYKSSSFVPPDDLVRCVESFKEFYHSKTKHRRLTWIYSLGTCNVIGTFDKNKIELILGTYQAATLVLFNDAEQLSYSDIQRRLNLGDNDLIRVLKSLSCGEYKILTKEGSSDKTVFKTSSFQFNSDFNNTNSSIMIPLSPVDTNVVEDVKKVRPYAIEASIVRIMKTRKVLSHQKLVIECTKQLGCKFKPDSKSIKKRIEDLITREYLERDKEDSNLYRYLS